MMLRTHDVEGRFEVKSVWVRKVPTGERGFHHVVEQVKAESLATSELPTNLTSTPARPCARLTSPLASPRRPSRSSSRSSSKSGASFDVQARVPGRVPPGHDFGADSLLVKTSEKSSQLDDKPPAIRPKDEEPINSSEPSCPPLPPGAHWTEYTDTTTGSWWFYDDPLGKFCAMDRKGPVLVVTDERCCSAP